MEFQWHGLASLGLFGSVISLKAVVENVIYKFSIVMEQDVRENSVVSLNNCHKFKFINGCEDLDLRVYTAIPVDFVCKGPKRSKK